MVNLYMNERAEQLFYLLLAHNLNKNLLKHSLTEPLIDDEYYSIKI